MLKPSISVFFPCYNDAGTIGSLVVLADRVLNEIGCEYEIIVIDDGSKDHSLDVLKSIQPKYPALRIVEHGINRGYGGALRSGFKHAQKDLVFYTDGDAQYDVNELKLLYTCWQENQADVVNGYKLQRNDPWYRNVIGKIYQYLMKWAFHLTIRDVDCDFRLMRRAIFDKVYLEHDSGVICVEMIYKIQKAGFSFADVPVHHYFRTYGRSQFFNGRRLLRVLRDLVGLWWRMVVLKKK